MYNEIDTRSMNNYKTKKRKGTNTDTKKGKNERRAFFSRFSQFRFNKFSIQLQLNHCKYHNLVNTYYTMHTILKL